MKTIQQLLLETERVCSLQKEIIENQSQQLANLESQIAHLKEQVTKWEDMYTNLQSSYDDVVDLCNQQQQLLNSILEEPDS